MRLSSSSQGGGGQRSETSLGNNDASSISSLPGLGEGKSIRTLYKVFKHPVDHSFFRQIKVEAK